MERLREEMTLAPLVEAARLGLGSWKSAAGKLHRGTTAKESAWDMVTPFPFAPPIFLSADFSVRRLRVFLCWSEQLKQLT